MSTGSKSSNQVIRRGKLNSRNRSSRANSGSAGGSSEVVSEESCVVASEVTEEGEEETGDLYDKIVGNLLVWLGILGVICFVLQFLFPILVSAFTSDCSPVKKRCGRRR